MTDTAVRRTTGSATWPAAQPWLTTVARVGLAAVLFTAGWAKFTEAPALQKLAVSAYQILPDSVVGVVGVGLPILEMALAAMLLAGFATRFVAAAGGVLMLVFIAGISSAWARGLHIDCGCFGGGGVTKQNPHYLQEILRDLGFLALAVWITILPKSKLAVDRLLGLYE
jgi:uncharacterized membrane protein YphA (DoxX/SURF4 family)